MQKRAQYNEDRPHRKKNRYAPRPRTVCTFAPADLISDPGFLPDTETTLALFAAATSTTARPHSLTSINDTMPGLLFSPAETLVRLALATTQRNRQKKERKAAPSRGKKRRKSAGK